jgi:SAM-dependent methyltransferase
MTEPSVSTATSGTFQPREYWSDLITGDGSLANVGHRALGEYNRYAYPLRLEALSRSLRGLIPESPWVFDAGFGEGVYLNYWQHHGAAGVSGLDFSGRAVAAARARHPNYELRQGDLSSSQDLAGFGRFDVVHAVDVLYHIVDDIKWAAALSNLASLVAPNGVFACSDKFPAEGSYQPMQHVRRRSFEMYRDVLAVQGFEVVRRTPVFVLMDDPISCGSHPLLGRLSQLQWKVLTKLVRMARVNPSLHRGVAYAVAHLQLPAERALLHLLKTTPNLELIVARRTAAAAMQA